MALCREGQEVRERRLQDVLYAAGAWKHRSDDVHDVRSERLLQFRHFRHTPQVGTEVRGGRMLRLHVSETRDIYTGSITGINLRVIFGS